MKVLELGRLLVHAAVTVGVAAAVEAGKLDRSQPAQQLASCCPVLNHDT